MLNPHGYCNTRGDGHAVLEVVDENPARRFVPLTRTHLTGTVTGPLATLHLAQAFALDDAAGGPIEALYRFPLPGDAAVTGVRVRFGDVEIQTALKERDRAEADYKEAKKSGRQAALLTRESLDVFTLAVTGIRAGQDVEVSTDYVQLAKPEGEGWQLRVPLTTAPRYVREDEAGSRHAAGQPLAVLRDPGHRFGLDLTFSGADGIVSPTHALSATDGRIRLRDGEVVPDRDCVITWHAPADGKPALRLWTHTDPAAGKSHFLALCTPPKAANTNRLPREVVLLVDHSGSMEGAKWEAADWAVERFLTGLSEHDSFALGLFHDTTKWFAQRPRKATPDAVREAVAYLKAHRDSGGTNLGVALEQALDRARTADTPSRHVLILTDAEVSDAGRVLRLADTESARPDRRRVSVLCIDAAPNAALATELAERGGGVSRFLTSNPNEDDVTTALDEVLADWSAPVLTGLALEVNRAGAEAAGRGVSLVVPGPGSAVDVGDLPAGRPVWVIGRVPSGGAPLSFRLRAGSELVAEARAEPNAAAPGLTALFGADRVRRLEYVMHANYAGEELRAELARLGYDTPATGSKVYAENARDATNKAVRELVVSESLAAGVASAETAFVAVRTEQGQPVQETRIVANALPSGWSDRFASGGGSALRAAAPPSGSGLMGHVVGLARLLGGGNACTARNFTAPSAPVVMARLADMALAEAAPAAERPASGARITIGTGQHAPGDGAVLYASDNGPAGQFTHLSVTFADKAVTADTVDPGLTLLLFVGDLAVPRAKVKLADLLRAGGRRPLNLTRAAGQSVRLVVADPAGAWKAGVPALEIVLG